MAGMWLLAGCIGFDAPGTPLDPDAAAPESDAAPGDAGCSGFSFAPTNVDPCALPSSGGALMLVAGDIALIDSDLQTIQIGQAAPEPVDGAVVAQPCGP